MLFAFCFIFLRGYNQSLAAVVWLWVERERGCAQAVARSTTERRGEYDFEMECFVEMVTTCCTIDLGGGWWRLVRNQARERRAIRYACTIRVVLQFLFGGEGRATMLKYTCRIVPRRAHGSDVKPCTSIPAHGFACHMYNVREHLVY